MRWEVFETEGAHIKETGREDLESEQQFTRPRRRISLLLSNWGYEITISALIFATLRYVIDVRHRLMLHVTIPFNSSLIGSILRLKHLDYDAANYAQIWCQITQRRDTTASEQQVDTMSRWVREFGPSMVTTAIAAYVADPHNPLYNGDLPNLSDR